ncbi:MAG TPA: hypothetical protein VNS88_04160 [Nitrospiraceae bacterium]|nr:hypothetical protein [Nitrospiraceae bacterium]
MTRDELLKLSPDEWHNHVMRMARANARQKNKDELIEQVRQGLASARYAARVLGCTVDDVCEAAFGEVTL